MKRSRVALLASTAVEHRNRQRAGRPDLELKMCPEIVARSPGCKERGEPKTGAYLDVCEDFRRDPRRRRLGPQ